MVKQFSPTLSEIHDAIVTILSAEVKAYDLSGECMNLGLPEGGDDDPWDSKAKYVQRRIINFDRERTIQLARDVLKAWDSFQLRESLRLFLCDNEPKITLVTRQRLQEKLVSLPDLTGRMSAVDFIGELVPVNDLPSTDSRFSTLFEDILQHNERNYDWGNGEILELIGLMSASDELLCEFFELMAHPTVREGADQSKIVDALNAIIGVDGFCLEETDNISGVPVFKVRRSDSGVDGRPKNLIFASNGPKPEIILFDAVNNDIEIVKNREFVLVYDRPFTHSGLTWTELVSWWKKNDAADSDNLDRSLFFRLRDSLASPPEKNFFLAYYKVFKDCLESWPALIPQVYLHYDPKTIRELAGKKRLIHQRMDFLLLLPNRFRVVIEIDGKQHYADDNGAASPARYAEMARADRFLKLKGYEVYRFGGKELSGKKETESVVREFFEALMDRHKLTPKDYA